MEDYFFVTILINQTKLLSDASSEYTLLIVESPTLAARLQDVAPAHVFVFSTEGFLWKPQYDAAKGKLGKKAVPNKLDLRNELRRQAGYAAKIVVATDSDPSGDFIAWTIHKDLKSKRILRGHLRHVSRSAIINLMRDAREVDFSTLHTRLENRFKIRDLWFDENPHMSMRTAGLLALFSEPIEMSEFRTDSGLALYCDRPLETELSNRQIELTRATETGWIHHSPLSTFDIIPQLRQSPGVGSFSEAQVLLQKTFEATNPDSGDGLITYPRTGNRSFFPDTWHDLQQQWTAKRSVNTFKPAPLRNGTPADDAHEAIRPVNIALSPAWVETHMPSDIGRAYRLIHTESIACIKMPEPAAATFQHEKSGVRFTAPSSIKNLRITVRPYLSLSELGYQLCRLGVLRPSGFGSFVDEAIKAKKITVDEQGEVHPRPELISAMKPDQNFSSILTNLHSAADNPTLTDETIRRILSS